MKFAHISDLHLGKRVNNFSLLEDQKYILGEMIKILEQERPDGVLIAGDVYDKAVPSAEAVTLFDDFLVQLAARNMAVFVISGNHDSPERIAFGGRLMTENHIYLSPVFDGVVTPVQMTDEFGEVNVYLLPFVKPVHVRHFYPDEEIASYTEALECVIRHMEVDESKRNVLVAHQFVTGASRCNSEEVSVGGLDNVDGKVFEPFDYVALGHIHGPQNVGVDWVRYCGTPMKYSFSEANHKKSVTIVELGKKKAAKQQTEPSYVDVHQVPLKAMRDFMKIKGTCQELTDESFYKGVDTDAYMHVTLVDEDDVPNAFNKLATVYPNLMQMEYDNKRTKEKRQLEQLKGVEQVRPMELFASFYERMNNQPLSEVQQEYLQKKIERIWEDER